MKILLSENQKLKLSRIKILEVYYYCYNFLKILPHPQKEEMKKNNSKLVIQSGINDTDK